MRRTEAPTPVDVPTDTHASYLFLSGALPRWQRIWGMGFFVDLIAGQRAFRGAPRACRWAAVASHHCPWVLGPS